jgi:hypothetical protein
MIFCRRFHRGAAEILVLTATGAIGNRNDADDNLHFLSRHTRRFAFFTKCTSEISISLSIALHMS